MKETVRVRFAPSPTGNLHVGGARTALFNWLFARHHDGKFLLRIEDTDRERSENKYTDDILGSLEWLGLKWDENPVFQSSRMERYQAVALSLLAQGQAYHCDCTAEALTAVREKCQKEKLPFRYPGTCREKKNASENSVIRLKMPVNGVITFCDMVRGDISFACKDLDDWVISRSTGVPTYNFAVVVDDHDQEITHILRGDDHINNTPRQMAVYQMLGWEIPKFAHLPMILGPDRSKLSKRHGAASTLEYRTMGYLPEALVNFLVRLGWSYGDQEIFSIPELIKFFSEEHIGKANAVFANDKLDWLNGHYLRSTPSEKLSSYMKQHFAEALSFCAETSESNFVAGVSIIQGKVKNIPELIEQLKVLFGPDPDFMEVKVVEEQKKIHTELLKKVQPVIAESDFSVESLEKAVRAFSEEQKLPFGKLAQAVRFGLTGGRVSPGLFEMLHVLGRDVTLRRFNKALNYLTQ